MQKAASGGRPCSVCVEGAAKYRCPGCRQRYCSVPCYKEHKEQCEPRKGSHLDPAKVTPVSGIQEMILEGKGVPWSTDDILTQDDEGDKVPLQKLQRLGESEELQGLLRNPHLRQLLVTVDRAGDKSALLRKSMQEPLFVEFADCCLRIVEPPGKENDPLA